MTDKQERILTTALELFANEGYNAVSTSKIAKQAEVSEGLIFRHFTNKRGLLDAILGLGERRINEIFSHIIFETNPHQVIEKAIRMPFSIKESEYDFWKLQFKLKWEAEYYHPQKMKPLLDKLSWAFAELGYEEADKEAGLLSMFLDAISIAILRDGLEAVKPFQEFLLSKYKQ